MKLANVRSSKHLSHAHRVSQSETADLADPRIRDEQFLTLIYVKNDK